MHDDKFTDFKLEGLKLNRKQPHVHFKVFYVC